MTTSRTLPAFLLLLLVAGSEDRGFIYIDF